jgi:hypothetical protein
MSTPVAVRRLTVARGRRRAWRLWVAAWLDRGRGRRTFPPRVTNLGWPVARPS